MSASKGLVPSLLALARSQWMLLGTAGLYGWAFAAAPQKALAALSGSAATFASVLPIVIAVFGLVGLVQEWLSREFVAGMLGREGGVRALVLAALSGTVLIGPAYVIFPLLMTIHRQGARWAVVATVLAAYAVKIPMIPLEVEFLGWSFSAGRALLTIALAIPIGLAVEAIMERRPRA